jgi:hypothetical protein
MTKPTIKSTILSVVKEHAPSLKNTSIRTGGHRNQIQFIYFDDYPEEQVMDNIVADLLISLAQFKITKHSMFDTPKDSFTVSVIPTEDDNGYMVVAYDCFSHKYA